jgi:oligo-1,6-glucosidase
MHREVFAGRDAELLTVGEMPGVTVEDAVLFTDPARGEVDMVFQFEHMDVDRAGNVHDVLPLDLRALKASLGRWQAGWPSAAGTACTGTTTTSRGGVAVRRRRDPPRAVGQAPGHAAAPAPRHAVRLPGRGARDDQRAVRGIEDFRDIASLNYYADAWPLGDPPEEVLERLRPTSRDNARTPMQWDASPHAGFTTGTPWIDVNPNHTEINAQAARADPDSVFHHYRRLHELRHDDPVVAQGSFTMLLEDDPQVYAFTRRLEDVELLVLANMSGEPAAPRIPDADGWAGAEVLVPNVAEPARLPDARLQPWEALVLRRTVA